MVVLVLVVVEFALGWEVGGTGRVQNPTERDREYSRPGWKLE